MELNERLIAQNKYAKSQLVEVGNERDYLHKENKYLKTQLEKAEALAKLATEGTKRAALNPRILK